MEQSIRNEIPGTVKEIISDKVLSEIIVETAIGEMAAVITTRSVVDMGLKVSDQVAVVGQSHQCFRASPRAKGNVK
jgi:molybdopterin-binding protein